MGRIELDYSRALTQAKKLTGIADDLRQMLRTRYSSVTGTVRSAWKGKNSDIYISKMDEVRNKIENTAKRLDELAGAIRTAAKKVYDAELRAKELAEKRSGSGGGSW